MMDSTRGAASWASLPRAVIPLGIVLGGVGTGAPARADAENDDPVRRGLLANAAYRKRTRAIDRIEDELEHQDVLLYRAAAYPELGRLRDPRIARVVGACLPTEAVVTRRFALHALRGISSQDLGRHGGPGLVAALTGLLEAEEPGTARAVRRHLQEIAGVRCCCSHGCCACSRGRPASGWSPTPAA